MMLLKQVAFFLAVNLAAASVVRRPVSGPYKRHKQGERRSRSRGPFATHVRRNEGSCSGGPWNVPQYVGASPSGSNDICETYYPGAAYAINQITIWGTSGEVFGLQFGYDSPSGLQSQVYGGASASGSTPQSITINYAAGETITSAQLYGSTNSGGYLGGLVIRTSAGQVVQGGYSSGTAPSGFSAASQDVGAGLLIGAVGASTSGYDINTLGLLFLDSPVSYVSVTDLSFPNGPAGAAGITPESLSAQHFYNGQDTNDTWGFSGSKTVTNTKSFTQSASTMYGTTVGSKITGTFPMILSVSGSDSFTWSSTSGTTDSTTDTETDVLTWKTGGTLAPGQGLTCDSLVGHGTGTFSYDSTVSVVLADGTVWATFSEPGSLYLDEVSSNSVVCNTDNSPS